MDRSADPCLPVSCLIELGFIPSTLGQGVFSLLPAGPFHSGYTWRWTCPTTGESRLLKARPDCDRNREHALLAWQLAIHPLWRSRTWLPAIIHLEKPWVNWRGMIFQAWSWLCGTVPDALGFCLEHGMERLECLSGIGKEILGERDGLLPCVTSREKAMLQWLEMPRDFTDSLDTRCAKVLGDWVKPALDRLERLPRYGKLLPCHGDPWAGNWVRIQNESKRLEYGLIDWSTVRWDNPASDRARLIGSTGSPDLWMKLDDGDVDRLLAWTGHLAALCNWMVKRKGGPWAEGPRERVEWLLFRMGE